MKTVLAFTTLALAAGGAVAQNGHSGEMGRVLSVTPVVQQVAVPQQYCGTQQVVTQAPRTGAGAVMGAVAGGVLGNAIGHGGGRAAATALGLVGGAVLGNNIEGPGATQVQNVQNCSTQTSYENRTVGYDVAYEYAGRRYNTRMASDPGQWVPVQVGAVQSNGYDGNGGSGYSAPQPAYTQAPAYTEPGVVVPSYYSAPTTVIASPPVVYAPSYYAAPAYAPAYVAPIGMSLNLGYSRGYGRGWR
ncbi:glycine zipper 2TM domain-containing protein [Sphingomonas sp. NCPPB 2930]